MTWVITAPADGTESDDRVHATAALAVVAVDTLQATIDLLEEIATADGPDNSAEWTQEAGLRATQVGQLRSSLMETFKIHKAWLSDQDMNRIQAAFDRAELGGDEHRAQRKTITEEVVGHPVERLRELDQDEVVRLLADLKEREPKF